MTQHTLKNSPPVRRIGGDSHTAVEAVRQGWSGPPQLLQHFDRIAEAPDAIPRLRRFILDLAVRGKLVEQDPNDEPASELLKRIEAEKERLVKEKKIKKPKALPPINKEKSPFSIPLNWQWIRLGFAFNYDAGTMGVKSWEKTMCFAWGIARFDVAVQGRLTWGSCND